MKKFLIASGIATLAFAAVAMAQGYSFQTNLTVGSTGADVTALQTYLIGAGFNIPAISSGAASKGYFGSQTQAAVKLFQAKNGVPNTGFVGPLTRGVLNGGSSVAMSSGCPAGYTCTLNAPVNTTCPAGMSCTPIAAGNTNTVTGGATGITTPGVQGIMSVTQGPVSVSTAYAGNTKVPILDARIQAQYSDLSVQSLQIDLGSNTAIYNYVYSTIYLIDPATNQVLASEPLNNSTVVQSSNDYIVGLAGFNFIVPKGTFKDLEVAVDLQSTILNNYLSGCTSSCATEQINGSTVTPWTVAIGQNSIRAIDGAGINEYGPGSSSGISQSMVISQNQTLSASASISLDAASPLVSSVPVTNLTAGSYLGLPIMVFDINAQGDNLHLHSLTLNVSNSGSGTVGAAYLYQGSTPIMSASVSNGVATFSNIPDGTVGAGIPINTSVPFTVKIDVSGLTASGSSEVVSATTTSVTVYNSADSSVLVSGTGASGTAGNAITVLGTGLNFSLSGTPTIVKVVSNSNNNGNATDTYTATFNVVAQAVGQSVTFGLPNSTSDSVGPSFGTTTTSANLVQIYQNGAAVSSSNTIPSGLPSVVASYSAPNNTTANSTVNTFTLGTNQSVTIPVTYSFLVGNPGASVYAIQLQGIATSAGTTTFMANQVSWRTPSI